MKKSISKIGTKIMNKSVVNIQPKKINSEFRKWQKFFFRTNGKILDELASK